MEKSRIALQRERERAENSWTRFASALPMYPGVDDICLLLESMAVDELRVLEAYLTEKVSLQEEAEQRLSDIMQAARARHQLPGVSDGSPRDPAGVTSPHSGNPAGATRIMAEIHRALPGVVLECIAEVLPAAESAAPARRVPRQLHEGSSGTTPLPTGNPLFDDLRDHPEIIEYFRTFDQDAVGRLVWDPGKHGKKEDLAYIIDSLYGEIDPILWRDDDRFRRAADRQFTYPDKPLHHKTLGNQAGRLRSGEGAPTDRVARMIRNWREIP